MKRYTARQKRCRHLRTLGVAHERIIATPDDELDTLLATTKNVQLQLVPDVDNVVNLDSWRTAPREVRWPEGVA